MKCLWSFHFFNCKIVTNALKLEIMGENDHAVCPSWRWAVGPKKWWLLNFLEYPTNSRKAWSKVDRRLRGKSGSKGALGGRVPPENPVSTQREEPWVPFHPWGMLFTPLSVYSLALLPGQACSKISLDGALDFSYLWTVAGALQGDLPTWIKQMNDQGQSMTWTCTDFCRELCLDEDVHNPMTGLRSNLSMLMLITTHRVDGSLLLLWENYGSWCSELIEEREMSA